MSIDISIPPKPAELKPKITVVGVGGAGGNAVNNMIEAGLEGVRYLVMNTDAQALGQSKAENTLQLGNGATRGLGAGMDPAVGRRATEESLDEILDRLSDDNMVFVTAGMGGGTGTGGAPVIARALRERDVLTVAVVTKPFDFEGTKRMRAAEAGLAEIQDSVNTLIVIANQNLFQIADDKTSFVEAFKLADEVLYSGVRGVTDLIVRPGFINLDFADVRTAMSAMGHAMMGTGESDGDDGTATRAVLAAERAVTNPLLDDTSIGDAKGILVNITGGEDMTLFEVDEAANAIRDQADDDAEVIIGTALDEDLNGRMRVSVFATGIQGNGARLPASNGVSPAASMVSSLTGEERDHVEGDAGIAGGADASAPVAEDTEVPAGPSIGLEPFGDEEELLLADPEETSEPEIPGIPGSVPRNVDHFIPRQPVVVADADVESDMPPGAAGGWKRRRSILNLMSGGRKDNGAVVDAATSGKETPRLEIPEVGEVETGSSDDVQASGDVEVAGEAPGVESEKVDVDAFELDGLDLHTPVEHIPDPGIRGSGRADRGRRAGRMPTPGIAVAAAAATAPALESASEPAPEPVPDPVAESVAEPVPVLEPAPVVESAAEPAPAPAPEPKAEELQPAAADAAGEAAMPSSAEDVDLEQKELLEIPAYLRRQAN